MRYRSLRRSTSLAAVLALVGQSPAWAEVPAVVTDVPVTHSLVTMVMGELGEPLLLLDQGADPHHFQLRPSQARAVEQAGLAVWVGAELTPWMARAVAGLAAGESLELLEVDGVALQPFQESRLSGEAAAHAQDHAHADEHDHDHDDHGHDHGRDHAHDDHHHAHGQHDDHADDHDDAHHGDFDPHAWLNPRNATPWLAAIAETLAQLDPANADTYRANAEAAVDEIAALEADVAQILAPVGDAGLVMYHDAYGYLATAFGLNVLGTIALGDAADPGAARLSAIRASLRDAGAVCVFPEVNHPDAYVALVAEADDALRVGAPLDPEGVSLNPGAGLYPTLIRDLATAIADCVVR